LAALPHAEVMLSHQVTGVSQGASGVEVAVQSPSAGTRTIRGAYVVGCDGASSAVRRGMLRLSMIDTWPCLTARR